MCGITGILSTSFDAERFPAVVATLNHRGPEQQGIVHLDAGVHLGHTRLRIIDLSESGRQPMSNEDDNVWIVFNGEIYNFLELRPELEKKGHRFKSKSDTEVIIHLYEGLQEDCLHRLNGMFAFAIYDRPRRRVLLARDPLGIKPLYYAYHQGALVFASEIKAILRSGIVPMDIDEQAMYDYLSYLYIPNPKTIFKGIEQVPPGHYLTFDLKTRTLKIENYWTPKLHSSLTDYGEMKDQLNSLLDDAVRRQMISDVPLGVFLSGGIDSTILTGLMAANSPQPVKTFTVVFEGEGIKPYDDRAYAQSVSAHFGTDHHELLVNVSGIDDLYQLMRYFDQPFANPTFYLSYLISKQTREHVTVALSGTGGDELFGGYPRYRILPYARYLSCMPRLLGRWTEGLLKFVPEDYNRPLIRRAKLLTRGLGQELPEQYLRWTYYFSEEEKHRLLRSDGRSPSARIIADYLAGVGPLVEADLYKCIQFLDLKTFLVDNVLEYTDRTSMAVALEVRVPYLDSRVVDLSFQIPSQYKMRKGISKYILKDTFKALIPDSVLRAPKRGFCPPLALWMDKYLDRYFDLFMPRSYTDAVGIFNWAYIQRLRQEHRNKKRDNSMELFGLIMFDVWYRQYISGSTV